MNQSKAKPKQVFSWRLLYAFIVVWLSAFTLLSPLARHEPLQFQSTAHVRYTLNPQRQFSDDELLGLLRSVVGQVTQPIVLDQIREKIGERFASPAGPAVALGTDDVNAIRRRLSISQDNKEGSLRLAISFLGKGGADDREFVNHLANQLALEIPRHSDQLAISQWMRANTDYLDMSKQVNLAEQIRAEVAQLNESLANLQHQATTDDTTSSTTDTRSLTAQVQDLEQQKAALVQDQGLDESHPEMMQLQQQIELLRAAILNDPAFRPLQVGVAEPVEPGDIVKNRFYQTSAKTAAEPAPTLQWIEDLATIDLSRIGSAATQLKAHAESIHDLKQDIDAALTSRYQANSQSFANLASVDYSTSPALLSNTRVTSTWLLIAPCLLGALVAMFYNPVRDRMHLKSVGDVARSLGLSIVGELPACQTTHPPLRSERWSAVCVRAAEYSIVAMVCVLIAACAMKPQVLSVALSNPLLALSNWFWLIAG